MNIGADLQPRRQPRLQRPSIAELVELQSEETLQLRNRSILVLLQAGQLGWVFKCRDAVADQFGRRLVASIQDRDAILNERKVTQSISVH